MNILHNQIDEVLSHEIRHYVENEYDVERVDMRNGYRNNEIKSLPVYHDIKIRDQLKVDKYVQNGNSYI